MQITHLPIVNQYIGKLNLFTDQDLIEADQAEKRWRESQPRLTLHQLLEIFPGNKRIVIAKLKNEIKQAKSDLVRAEENRIRFNNKILSWVKYENKETYSMIRDMFYVRPWQEGREQLIKRNYFMLSSLKEHKPIPGKITQADIDRAKHYPIENLYTERTRLQGRAIVGICPFHAERTASFTIYTNENRWWCFGGCGGGDAIDYVVKRDNCDFVMAVKKLLHA